MPLDYQTGYTTVQLPPQSGTAIPQNPSLVIDGTPVRIGGIAIAAAAMLIALRWGGFKFSSTVSVS